MGWPDILVALDRYGVALAMLAIMVIAIAKSARWIAPRLDRMFERHIQLVDTVQASVANIETHMAKQSEHIAKQSEVLGEIESRVTAALNQNGQNGKPKQHGQQQRQELSCGDL